MISFPAGRGFFVYEHRDESGAVLYVGMTTHPAQRIANHVMGRRSPWWEQVCAITWHEASSEWAMRRLEGHLIERHDPPFNRTVNLTRRVKAADAAWRRSRSLRPYRDVINVTPVSTGDAARWLRNPAFVEVLDLAQAVA